MAMVKTTSSLATAPQVPSRFCSASESLFAHEKCLNPRPEKPQVQAFGLSSELPASSLRAACRLELMTSNPGRRHDRCPRGGLPHAGLSVIAAGRARGRIIGAGFAGRRDVL